MGDVKYYASRLKAATNWAGVDMTVSDCTSGYSIMDDCCWLRACRTMFCNEISTSQARSHCSESDSSLLLLLLQLRFFCVDKKR